MDLHYLKSNCKAHTKNRDYIAVSCYEITKTLRCRKLLYFRRGKLCAYCQWQAASLTVRVQQGLLQIITFAYLFKEISSFL